MNQIAPALIAAQRQKTPEGRMAEAALFRRLAAGKSLRMKNGTPTIDRLMSKIRFGASDCWYWIGSINRLGYGVFAAEGEVKAHRVSYKLFNGQIPEGAKVMHTCDTRCCVNPAHLVTGTQAENIADMVAKGRASGGDVRGERNPMAKATAAMVTQIRDAVAAGAKQIDVAREHGLSKMTVSRIVRKESWNG